MMSKTVKITCPYCGAVHFRATTSLDSGRVVPCKDADSDIPLCGRSFLIDVTYTVTVETSKIVNAKQPTLELPEAPRSFISEMAKEMAWPESDPPALPWKGYLVTREAFHDKANHGCWHPGTERCGCPTCGGYND